MSTAAIKMYNLVIIAHYTLWRLSKRNQNGRAVRWTRAVSRVLSLIIICIRT